jgi:peptide chain release factor 1
VHTSTITVAVLPVPAESELVVHPDDLEWSTCRASGSGGQHLQKTESAVQVRHLPSGLMVRCESERSQAQNKLEALAVLRARLFQQIREGEQASRNAARRGQIGSGERGDKRRTIREQEGTVVDHVLGVRLPLRSFLRGDLEALMR